MSRPRPVVLVILDGFGERAEREDNAVRLAKTPELDALFAKHPHSVIGTSGPAVGLPPGQMGNSEVGHLNFGAGRIAMMDISRIDNAVFDGSLGKNAVIAARIAEAKASGSSIREASGPWRHGAWIDVPGRMAVTQLLLDDAGVVWWFQAEDVEQARMAAFAATAARAARQISR